MSCYYYNTLRYYCFWLRDEEIKIKIRSDSWPEHPVRMAKLELYNKKSVTFLLCQYDLWKSTLGSHHDEKLVWNIYLDGTLQDMIETLSLCFLSYKCNHRIPCLDLCPPQLNYLELLIHLISSFLPHFEPIETLNLQVFFTVSSVNTTNFLTPL